MTGQHIDTAAAEWAARLDRGLTPAERAELAAWSGADVRRAGALARAMAVLARVEQLDAPVSDLGRRWLLMGGGGLLAAGVAAVAARGVLVSRDPLTSRPGEVRLARLKDGTRVILNGDTHIQPGAAPREVVLTRGEAIFEVAADPSRPFVVRARDMAVTASGGVFAVRLPRDGPRQVLVRDGPVQAGSEGQETTELISGCWATASERGEMKVAHLGKPRIVRALAWADQVKA